MYRVKKADGSKSPVTLHNTDTGEITTIGILTPELKQALIDLGMEKTEVTKGHRVSVNDPRDWDFQVSTRTAFSIFGIIVDMNRRIDASDVILGMSQYNKYKVEGGKVNGRNDT